MKVVELYNNDEVVITVGGACNVDDIARFQVDMAMETEGLALDYECVSSGVQAVIDDEAKGRYIIAEIGGKVVACLMITREWSDWNNCWYGGYRAYMCLRNTVAVASIRQCITGCLTLQKPKVFPKFAYM